VTDFQLVLFFVFGLFQRLLEICTLGSAVFRQALAAVAFSARVLALFAHLSLHVQRCLMYSYFALSEVAPLLTLSWRCHDESICNYYKCCLRVQTAT
jgi:hypothetical protein